MTEGAFPSRWGRLADAVLLLFVLGLGVKAVAGAGSVRDFDDGDECSYTIAASAISERGLPPVEGSPLYIVWDWLLLKAGVAPEDVPARSWAALAVLLPAAISLLVRSLGGGRVAALVAGGMMPATTLIDIWPYPMHLATLVLVSGTAIAARLRPAACGATLGLTLLTATYARPEFLYSVLLYLPVAACGAVWLARRRPAERRGLCVALAALVCGAGLLVWAFGSPKGETGRSGAAFGQHYALNRHDAGARPEHPWLHWELYVRADFGAATSLGEAWRNNPNAFLWHVATNARHLPGAVCEVAVPRVDLLGLRSSHIRKSTGPSRHPTTEALARWVLLASVAVGLFGTLIGLRNRVSGSATGDRLPVAVAMLAFVGAPALAASLLIYPRFHYLIPTVVYVASLSAAGARHLPLAARWGSATPTAVAAIGAAVALALVVPNRAAGWCVQSRLGRSQERQSIAEVPTPLRASVRAIRDLGLRPPVVFLDFFPMASFYAGFGSGFVSPIAVLPGERFADFIRRANIGVVVLHPFLAEYPQIRDDPDFRALVEGRDSGAFAVFPVEGYALLRIAVRRDLLPAPPPDTAAR
ncbi:hypothetical protein [Frigoriglobus tundricola]|uniref:Glycosyltransferase RgtA/B/C/D-like domain-containing protein n=1 Tax=Frigoriglobus tundricola TaxID=2774151 RepID=A0A6M5Z2Q2_9BACT|nr:hypothetical protein [Frigoriglobus tundricola]QJW99472.1 hypothetical protein FTUN_7084 [Frigoriglobus tundricola]